MSFINITPVQLQNTFNDWVNRTNSLINVANELKTGPFVKQSGTVSLSENVTVTIANTSDAAIAVAGGATFTGNVTSNRLEVSGNVSMTGTVGDKRIFATENVNLLLGTNNSVRLTITNAGNVGIGISSPTQKLQVDGNVAATLFVGSGASITTLNANSLATGTVPLARLGTGTPTSENFLSGDNSWKTVLTQAVTQVTTANGIAGGPITTIGELGLTGQALALHNLGTNGIIARTGAANVVARSITTSNGISVTNANGVAGNIAISTTGTLKEISKLDGTPTLGFLHTRADVMGFTDQVVARQINSTGTGISVSNGDGLSGNPTIALTGQALALNNLATNGIIVRTGAASVAARSIASGTGISVATANGVSGNPTISVTAAQPTITSVGTLTSLNVSGDITAFASSDSRLKENITVISDALECLNQIDGVRFDWKDDHIEKLGGEDGYLVRKRDVGVIAQDILKILPEVVGEREDGTLAVKYEKIVALLIAAIKELDKKHNDLLDYVKNIEHP